MDKADYRKYINSPDWIARRNSYLRVWNVCNRCDLPRWLACIAYSQDLNVHHRHYLNLGRERPEDLEALCKRCHEIETFGHSQLPKINYQRCPGCGQPNFDRYAEFCARCMAVHDYLNAEHLRALSPAQGKSLEKKGNEEEKDEGILRGEGKEEAREKRVAESLEISEIAVN